MLANKMLTNNDSFLPYIQSVFYAKFDVDKGPMILYQVPEGLIGVPPSSYQGTGSMPTSPVSSSTPTSDTDFKLVSPKNTSDVPAVNRRTSRNFSSPKKHTDGSDKVLFNFHDISKYIIPPSALCGRLVTCTAGKYRIIGFPVKLRGDFKRNYFRYNLCFVFDRSADLSCYEPIVRKISRVLLACEVESKFLSSPTSSAIHSILEQLYEDLNSYSESHIPINQFNSIELKLFPFYPNPPAVKDWMVPLALINLNSRIEANWDLTLVKVCQFIDGVNHVSRIAQLADCDLDLTRQAISQLLYYQVVMTIDIFQFSNMYALSKSIQWLADEAHVREECGPYVTRQAREIPDWPKLLHLYSRLKPGKTVFEWMEAFEVYKLGIDVRRFTSFGVIKGFLRRVHRWPVLLSEHRPQPEKISMDVARIQSDVTTSLASLPTTGVKSDTTLLSLLAQQVAHHELTKDSTTKVGSALQITRKASVAETVLGEVQSKDLKLTGGVFGANMRIHHARDIPQDGLTSESSISQRHSLHLTPASIGTNDTQNVSKSSIATVQNTPRTRLSKSPSLPNLAQASSVVPTLAYPPDILPLLDGEHHTDELATKFEVGWPLLEQWLVAAGGGNGHGDFGRICIIYR